MAWKSLMIMIILDLFIELQMSVNILIIGLVDLGKGFILGLMYTMER